ncbi:hypothetical protein HMPREF3192_00830 [Atopobium deltae]|uniref:Uncharacterized protein n=1 Tax=Atopobium deltae TaxID=1393034 RepID=A0A133XTY3_9ACTN|nr:hypothetical protein HMPREF3192_00830 [Atopobium deltae]
MRFVYRASLCVGKRYAASPHTRSQERLYHKRLYQHESNNFFHAF